MASTLGGAYTLFGDQFAGDTEARLLQVGELLTATQKKYKFTVFSELGEGLREVAAQATTSNLPLEQTAAALGLLAKGELAGSRGGTALSAVLRQLKNAADELHVPIVRNADDSLDLVATLGGLSARLNRIGDTDVRNQVIQKLFGDEGARGLAPLLLQLDLFREGVDAINNPVVSLDESHQVWLDSASGKSAILRNNLTSLRDTIATGLVPAVEPLIGSLTGAAVEIGAMAERSPLLATGLKLAAGAAGTFVGASLLIRGGRWAVLQLVDSYDQTVKAAGAGRREAARLGGAAVRGGGAAARGVGRLVGALVRVSRVGRVATAVTWLWNAALLANPIGATVALVVAGAALIGGAVYLIYKYWEPIKAFFSNLLGAVTAEFAPVVEAWSAVFTDFSWAGVGKAIIKTLVGGVVGSASLLWDGVTFVFGKVSDLWPNSDARSGPLSRLTASGGAILRTIGDGVQRAGPGALRRPLAAQLTAAATGLALAVALVVAAPPAVVPVVATAPAVAPVVAPPAAPAVAPVVAPPAAPAVAPVVAPPAAPAVVPVVAAAPAVAPVVAPPAAPAAAPAPIVNNYNVTVNAAPGEDVSSLARRVMDEIERQQSVRARRARHDDL